MQNPKIEIIVALVFAIFIVVGLYLTSQIDMSFSSDLETFSGPRAYPGIILFGLLLLILIIASNNIRLVIMNASIAFDKEPFFHKNSGKSGALVAALLVFILTFEHIGYILTMVPFLIVVALLCGAKSTSRAFFISFCLSAICLIIFRYGLSTVLPEGLFGIDGLFKS